MKGFVRSLLSAAFIGATVSTPAFALCALPGFSSSSTVNTGSTWLYTFTVVNGCASRGAFLTDVFLPYFSDAAITDIRVPDVNTSMFPGSTVTWSVITQLDNNLFGLAGAGAIDFHVAVDPELSFDSDTSLPGVPSSYFSEGFSFTSIYAPVEGPSAAELAEPDGSSAFVFIDPPIPGSPSTITALETTPTTTPEPATLSLLATGLIGMAAVIRKRRSV
jgi:PEP-CTERM motif-containing protein